MTNADDPLLAYLLLQKPVLASLRLKDVLDAVINQLYSLTAGAKVAVLLADNDALALKLMAAKGYSARTLDLLKTVPFSSDSLLKGVVQKRAADSLDAQTITNDMSGVIMKNEESEVQIALPLIASNLLVGAILIDGKNRKPLEEVALLSLTAEMAALSIANAIRYGRSEYERERIKSLHKTASSFASSVLKTSEVLQIGVDTALHLAGTPSGAILLYNAEKDSFELGAFKGLDSASLHEFDLSAKETVAGTTLRSGRVSYLGDGTRQPFGMPPAASGFPFSSALVLPLINKNTPLGVIEVFSTEHNAFHSDQVYFLELLAGQLASALYTSLLHESAALRTLEDAHTGLYSRSHFEESLSKECERSARHHHQLGLLMIDLDHLSHVNQSLGEERGDEAIRSAAQAIKQTVRDMDIVCRYGGEEFAVILPETQGKSSLEVAERIRTNVRLKDAPGVGVVTVSIGLSSYPEHGESALALIQAAQEALHVAKYQGRNRTVVAPPNQAVKVGPISWMELVKQAKLSVIGERQARLQSKRSSAPEYAEWMTRSLVQTKQK
jgi:diguanylate cyclase (GGDEF)-like protein